MSSVLIKWVRGTVITLLVLLVVQYEFGMATNLSDPNSIPAFGFSISNVFKALNTIGFEATAHAMLGTTLTVFSLVSLVLALATKLRNVQIFGALSFLSIAFAETNGILFTLSGFQNDHYSHGMATMFILTFGLYFIELYFLKPPAKQKTSTSVKAP
jgi:hypothetical protein